MGFTITLDQDKTFKKIENICLHQTKTQNGFLFQKRHYFFEVNEQLPDGTIPIEILCQTENNYYMPMTVILLLEDGSFSKKEMEILPKYPPKYPIFKGIW
jgi:hypothetical protein